MGRISLDESKYRNSDSNLVILTNPDGDYIGRVMINATRHRKACDFPNGFHVIFLIIDPNFAESIQILDKAVRYINTRRTLIIATIIPSEKQKILEVLNKIKAVQDSIKPLLPYHMPESRDSVIDLFLLPVISFWRGHTGVLDATVNIEWTDFYYWLLTAELSLRDVNDVVYGISDAFEEKISLTWSVTVDADAQISRVYVIINGADVSILD